MNIMCIAPHPDDEAIGCGGTLRKHVVDGDHVVVVYCTSGEKGGGAVQREIEAGVCSQILGTHELYFLHYPDGGFDRWQDPNEYDKLLESLLEVHKPDIIYCPNRYETHVDHYGAYEWVNRVTPGFAPRALVRFYEVWTPLKKYNVLVDIGPYIDHKRAAIRAYESQAFNAFDEATLALNHYRGIMHGPNKMYAEVFYER